MNSTIIACLVLAVIGIALYAIPKKENAVPKFFGALFFSIALLFFVESFATFTTAMVVALIALFIGTITLLGARSWVLKIIFIIILIFLAYTIGGLLDFYPEDSFLNRLISLITQGVRDMIDTISAHSF